MNSNLKKSLIITPALISILLLSSCTWNSSENIKENTSSHTTNSMNAMWEKEWTAEEMAEMENMEGHWTDMTNNMWTYSDYSESKLAKAEWNIVLFFHATWCPSCKSANKNLSSDSIPKNLTVLKLDYDSNSDLKKKYGITSQHTFVQVDNTWKLIKKWSGSRNINDIIKKVK